MHAPRYAPRRALAAPLVFATYVILFPGCDTFQSPLDPLARRRLDGAMPPVTSPVIEVFDDNNAFERAQPATLPLEGEITIQGSIDAGTDVDVFALGPALAGDRIIVDVFGHDGLNTVAALFDADQDLVDANDDRGYYTGQLDPYLHHVLQRDASKLYVTIAVSRARGFSSPLGRHNAGRYAMRVQRQPGSAPHRAGQQVVYLNFEGGNPVQIALEPVELMRPFSAESISGRFAGQTESIIALVEQHMQRDFAPFNVTFVNSRRFPPPSTPHSTLYFGNFNQSFFGLADSVDTANLMPVQEAIIYAEDLRMFENLEPSVEEVAQALANIASHELGHLLGLEHTGEAGDLMATATTARQLLEVDAIFGRSQLDPTVFPVGWQNDVNLLLLNVGPAADGAARTIVEEAPARSPRSVWRDQIGMTDIPIAQCQQCRR